MSKLAVITDFPEEGWPSMDLVAEMLLRHWPAGAGLSAERVCAPYRRRFERLPGPRGVRVNADRLMNRMWSYPRYLRTLRGQFAAYHLVDHSYSQLVHELKGERVGVFCHDLDTFRCVLDPAAEPRPRWFRAMTRRILDGFAKADVVFHTTAAVREQILRHGLIDERKLVQVPLGVAAEFSQAPGPDDDALARQAFGGRVRYLLHVGSCIARKRIDVLLAVFARVAREDDAIRLLQVGGAFTDAQQAQIDELGIAERVRQVRGVSRGQLAGAYRSAAAVLVTSDAEGFGLPVIEAMACGASVVASDIAVLREVGGEAVRYAPVGEVDAWAVQVRAAIVGDEPQLRDARIARASTFSWVNHARRIAETYDALTGAAR
jgi:glycosyltransferase involved in cell wall biosynthesis